MAAVWCPDWPVTAAAPSGPAPAPGQPVAVVVANHVLACSPAAREHGVRRGQRRREAQSRCPELLVLPRDEAAEARAFEPVVAALESVAPGVEITRPGLAAIALRGPTRYFGGEPAVLRALARAIAALPIAAPPSGALPSGALPPGLDVSIGAADGAFAAEQAARRGVIVGPGASPRFLADLPIETLDLPDLVDLLRRLGLRTLGSFAALPARDVLARFGPSGAWAHRQAGGRDVRPLAARRPPVELAVTLDLDPPVDRVDAVAFSARGVAERFVTDLAAHGLACTCLELRADSDFGGQTVRRWRHTGVLGPTDVLDRVRWQLEGWRGGSHTSSSGGSPAGAGVGPIVRLRLAPVEVVPLGAHQQALWGGPGANDERAERALARVQTLLGPGSVLTPVRAGGRDPRQRSRLVPWGDERTPARSPQQPWPGQLPAPAPSVLLDPPRPARVLDADGRAVLVTERGAVPRPPARFALGDGRPVPITSWAGPWPVDERWWSPDTARRTVRCQLVDVHGRAYLVTGTMTSGGPPSSAAVGAGEDGPRWQADAVYD